MNHSSLREGVYQAYSAVAESPQAQHPFPNGRIFAESLGYPLAVLDEMPGEAVEAFAGVSDVSIFADIPAGVTVLDVGCGAGLDSLIAARRTGPGGRVIGLDFSAAMLARAAQAATAAGSGSHVEFQQADAEQMPIADASIDVALVLQRDFTFPIKPDVAYDGIDRLLHGDAGNS
jgi:arsenite methyltransferase